MPQLDYPFRDVVKKAEKLAASGMDVYQKFTCAGCGRRLTMDQPNVFHEKGTCDNCPVITDIKDQGCNYLVHLNLGRRARH